MSAQVADRDDEDTAVILSVPAAGEPGGRVQDAVPERLGIGIGEVAVEGQQLGPGHGWPRTVGDRAPQVGQYPAPVMNQQPIREQRLRQVPLRQVPVSRTLSGNARSNANPACEHDPRAADRDLQPFQPPRGRDTGEHPATFNWCAAAVERAGRPRRPGPATGRHGRRRWAAELTEHPEVSLIESCQRRRGVVGP
jgi:hypothetical protein